MRRYSGERRAAAEVATLRLAQAIRIDDVATREPVSGFAESPGLGLYTLEEEELQPGTYVITTSIDQKKLDSGEGPPRKWRELEPAEKAGTLAAVGALVIVSYGQWPPSHTPRWVCEGETIELLAEVGHTYMLEGSVGDDGCRLWIEDVNTGEIVSGVEPQAIETSQ